MDRERAFMPSVLLDPSSSPWTAAQCGAGLTGQGIVRGVPAHGRTPAHCTGTVSLLPEPRYPGVTEPVSSARVLAAHRPGLCCVRQVGVSRAGRPLHLLSVGDRRRDTPGTSRREARLRTSRRNDSKSQLRDAEPARSDIMNTDPVCAAIAQELVKVFV